MSIRKLITTLILGSTLSSCQLFDSYKETDVVLSSPGNHLELTFKMIDGAPKYEVTFDNEPIISTSDLGFVLKDQPNLLDNFEVVDIKEKSIDEKWETIWGQSKEVDNNYNELTVFLKEKSKKPREMQLIFRAFDDGLGFRYFIPTQENISKIEIMSEETTFNLVDNYKVWYQPCDTIVSNWEHGFDTYERLYEKAQVTEVKTLMHTPATFETKSGDYVSIHEANLTDYSTMTLDRGTKGTSFESYLVPWPDGVKVKRTTPMYTPWRTVQVGHNPGDLVESNIILNLNEPNKIEDVSFIKPMKYLGVWWEMHMNKSTWEQGPNHGANTENTKKYIDFAASNGLGGVLVEGWNKGWEDWITNPNFNFVEPYSDYDLKYLASYAKEKGVELIGHHETSGDILTYENQMDDAFDLLEKNEMNALKTGYVGKIRAEEEGQHHHGQYMVNHYRKVLETAAKHKVCVVAHEPIKPTGIRRTYPNMLSREAMRGMEYNAWSDGNPASHTTILPFTMGLGGPLDYTPGIFQTNFDKYRKGNSTHTTVANQLALYVVLYSPVQMAADLPEHYEGNPAFQFIREVPTDWEESKVLTADIGEYVAVARKDRKSNDWYIGAITNEEKRALEIPIDFLEDGKEYIAEIYADGTNASYKVNATDVDIKKVKIRNGEHLSMHLAEGGGQAIRIHEATTGKYVSMTE
ncbi:glycoside hydrolase family 97 protein [Flammeovirga kamogawensis]|uniref:Glycoside hydrolase family 97 protein n=1 Tax=Flammeovirga kamogawensis TaxID=373891 RepID=A0ABX8H2C0_9BACT|nr:glycoside hydrolase family 97 protein [Flammeovirga kamogawensis]MBB6463289.1 alpha-glucosidase [Flammeovirga kamogawensis]QWG09561.1 glycoside hydrolase family 97 protein [Flammeovirga kamogawensis]TRX65075.1 glycoside hydrolase family 97 protein [Flammeovirga kamogawensis]